MSVQDTSFSSGTSFGNSTVTSTLATSDCNYPDEGGEDEDKDKDKASINRSLNNTNNTSNTNNTVSTVNAAEQDTTGLSKKAILQLKLKRKILELDEGA